MEVVELVPREDIVPFPCGDPLRLVPERIESTMCVNNDVLEAFVGVGFRLGQTIDRLLHFFRGRRAIFPIGNEAPVIDIDEVAHDVTARRITKTEETRGAGWGSARYCAKRVWSPNAELQHPGVHHR